MEDLSRRGFLKSASLGLAGAGVFASGAVALAGCTPAEEEDVKKFAGNGTGEATAKGYGGEIKVVVNADITTGAITDIEIDGGMETPIKGGLAVQRIAAAIKEAGSLDIDTVAGATITTTATMLAAAAAYGKAMHGEELDNQKMKPGSYTASAKSGFWRIYDLPVTVTVNEDAILKIEVPEDRFEHGDTEVFLNCAKEKFIPRVIENQSLSVDTVSSATLSCNGVRNAAIDAIAQAFVANDVDASAAGKFAQYVDLTSANAPETIETDVLVVGLGNGGLFAMLSACETIQARNGGKLVSILGIDKAGRIGGKSILTHEACAVNPKKFGLVDNNGEDYVDKEDFRARWKHFASVDGKLMAKEECIDTMVDQSGETIDWLFSHGWRYGTVAKGAGYDLAGGRTCFNSICASRADPGTYEDRRGAVSKLLHDFVGRVEAQGGKIMLETEGYGIETDGTKVTAVKARNVVTGQEYVIKAKAVIMNTGGFSSNPEMTSTLLDEKNAGFYLTVGTGCDTGLMVKAAMDAGAGTYNIGMSPILMHCGPDHWIEKYPFTPNMEKLQYRHGRYDVTTLNGIPNGCADTGSAIAVRPNGKRFMNEFRYEDFSKDIDVDSFAHWAGGPHYFTVLSDEVISEIAKEGFNHISSWDSYNTQGKIPANTPVPEVYEGLGYAIEEGMAWKADTIEELAELAGIDKAGLVATVNAFNGYVDAGVDEEFGKEVEHLRSIKKGPFYAIKVYNTTFGTCGGLDVDAQMRVLKADGVTPIDGLYAIGCDSLGVVHNPTRHYCGFGGVAQMWLQTGGRIAGVKAAEYIGDGVGFATPSEALSEIPGGF